MYAECIEFLNSTLTEAELIRKFEELVTPGTPRAATTAAAINVVPTNFDLKALCEIAIRLNKFKAITILIKWYLSNVLFLPIELSKYLIPLLALYNEQELLRQFLTRETKHFPIDYPAGDWNECYQLLFDSKWPPSNKAIRAILKYNDIAASQRLLERCLELKISIKMGDDDLSFDANECLANLFISILEEKLPLSRYLQLKQIITALSNIDNSISLERIINFVVEKSIREKKIDVFKTVLIREEAYLTAKREMVTALCFTHQNSDALESYLTRMQVKEISYHFEQRSNPCTQILLKASCSPNFDSLLAAVKTDDISHFKWFAAIMRSQNLIDHKFTGNIPVIIGLPNDNLPLLAWVFFQNDNEILYRKICALAPSVDVCFAMKNSSNVTLTSRAVPFYRFIFNGLIKNPAVIPEAKYKAAAVIILLGLIQDKNAGDLELTQLPKSCLDALVQLIKAVAVDKTLFSELPADVIKKLLNHPTVRQFDDFDLVWECFTVELEKEEPEALQLEAMLQRLAVLNTKKLKVQIRHVDFLNLTEEKQILLLSAKAFYYLEPHIYYNKCAALIVKLIRSSTTSKRETAKTIIEHLPDYDFKIILVGFRELLLTEDFNKAMENFDDFYKPINPEEIRMREPNPSIEYLKKLCHRLVRSNNFIRHIAESNDMPFIKSLVKLTYFFTMRDYETNLLLCEKLSSKLSDSREPFANNFVEKIELIRPFCPQIKLDLSNATAHAEMDLAAPGFGLYNTALDTIEPNEYEELQRSKTPPVEAIHIQAKVQPKADATILPAPS